MKFLTRPGLRVPENDADVTFSTVTAFVPPTATVPCHAPEADSIHGFSNRHGDRKQLLGLRGGAIGQQEKERNTGTDFPGEFCHISKANCPSLVGVGSRRKRLLGLKNIDVYALGFYIDRPAAQKALSKSTNTPNSSQDQICEGPEQKQCAEILDASDVEKTVRIVVTSGMVNHDKFVSGLRDSLLPACQKAGDAQSMPAFEQLFEGTEFRKGLELAFTSTKEGGLAARIDNRDVGEVKSPQFSRAFFSLYLGKDPVSHDGRNNIKKGLSELLASAEPVSQE